MERIAELRQTARDVRLGLADTRSASPEEVREHLATPRTTVDDVLGRRPVSILDRDSWSRAAARLVSAGTATLDLAPGERMMEADDMGLER